ncbi:MAG: decaprenyl-phosphate phosphoribosyltransferase [Candidatus Omnitrophica bacterium]|nr:decaprenyl-phosphate phosphoribosyltransferase [Candidatus Omnitrophota bacterium]
MKNNIVMIFNLLRVKQWVKNAFIFFPLIFAGKLFEFDKLTNTLLAFLGFCLIASGLYVINDYLDRHKDRLHPKKSQRPLAKTEFSKIQIGSIVLVLLCLGLLVCSQVNVLLLLTAMLYIGISLIYNFITKFIVILDVIFVALGFHLRIWAGAMACDVIPSVWLQMCVFLLALFLGFTKRRHEIGTLGSDASAHRDVLSHYTVYFLDQIILICSTLAIVFYGLYTMSPEIIQRHGGNHMVYSVVFVIYGIFRYLYLSHVKKQGGDPGEILATDTSLLIDILLWITFLCIVLYYPTSF